MSDLPITYIPEWASPELSRDMFDTLWHDLAWLRIDRVPRREYWTNLFDRPYTYGVGDGQRTYEPQPTHSFIEGMREAIAEETGVAPLEGCFLNGYESGNDALGWHADDDPRIDHTRPIAVLTLYPRGIARPRVIHVKAMDSKGEKPDEIELGQGSLLLMHPGMQQTHKHKIPRPAGFVPEERISLTFRGLI